MNVLPMEDDSEVGAWASDGLVPSGHVGSGWNSARHSVWLAAYFTIAAIHLQNPLVSTPFVADL